MATNSMTQPRADLSPHYYRDNFMALCDAVEAQYHDLLNTSELGLLQTLRELPFSAQCLYVRLVSRVGPNFRESKLSYPEIGPLDPALDALIDSGLLQTIEILSADDAGKLFTVAELRDAFETKVADARSFSKADLLCALKDSTLSDAEILQACAREESAQRHTRIVGITHIEHIALFQLLFFGNRYQSLTEFVLSDMGVRRFYPYSISAEARMFPSREALDEYLLCLQLSDQHYEYKELQDVARLIALGNHVAELPITHTSTASRWNKLCNRLARDLERADATELALRLYERSSSHPARERRARILERHGDFQQAQQLCEAIAKHPWCESEFDAGKKIAARVTRKLGGAARTNVRDAFHNIYLQVPPGELSVEQRAADFILQNDDWDTVEFVENRLMNALFALAFWEQIFQPIPGAFSHPFQAVPHDMYDGRFRPNRESDIAVRLQLLAYSHLENELVAAYRRYFPYQCQWVNWHRVSEDMIAQACRNIPATHLIAIWERLLFDPKENRRGFPDLIAFNNAAQTYRFIEVKGPGDKLQDHQKRWLRYFQQHSIPAEVAWMEYVTPAANNDA